MGGVSVATVNDESALAMNPAGLGRLRDFYGTILDPEVDISKNVPDMQRVQSFNQPTTLSDVMPSILASKNTYYHARSQLFPSFVAKNFGIGLLGKYTLDGIASSNTSVDTFYRDDLALLLGFNFRLWGGRIKIGFTGKVISRVELNEKTLNPTSPYDLNTLASTGKLKEGVGAGGDVGILLTAPWTYLPAIGAVVRDVGGTPFDKATGIRRTDTTVRPDAQVQDMDVGVSISPIHSNGVRSTWGLEYQGVLTASQESDKAKLLHFGTEFNLGDVLFLRAGYNQRYWTAGFELASEHFQFQLASYGVEVGDEVTPTEDRRYNLKISFRF